MRRQNKSVMVIGPVGEPKAPGNGFRELPSMQLLAAYLAANGVCTKFVWGTVENILSQIGKFRPDVVAMTSFWNSGYEALATRILRSFPSIKVATGGYDVTGRSKEGEVPKVGTWFVGPSFKALLNQLDSLEPWPAVVHGLPDEPSIDEMPPPIRIGKLITGSHFNGRLSIPAPSKITGVASLTGSVGCPGICAFCANSLMNRCQVQRRDPTDVVREAIGLTHLGANLIYMTDEAIDTDLEWLDELCEQLIAVKFSKRAKLMAGARAGGLSLAMLHKMKKAGFGQLGVGIEWTEEVRGKLKGKGALTDLQLHKFALRCDEVGIISMGFTLLGPWCKSDGQIVNDFKQIRELGFDLLSCNEVLAFKGTGLSMHGWEGLGADARTLRFPTDITGGLGGFGEMLPMSYHLSDGYIYRTGRKCRAHPELERSFREAR